VICAEHSSLEASALNKISGNWLMQTLCTLRPLAAILTVARIVPATLRRFCAGVDWGHK
jgi:hypothetical protein